MFVAEFQDGKWDNARITPFRNLQFSPASCVFHYGQAIFEGLKAYKTDNKSIVLFRPEENWKRMNASAERMSMPTLPKDLFINGIKELIKVDSNWVPDAEDQSLYVRPFMIANDAFLGVKPSKSYQFIVFTSPIASYYNGAVKVKIETTYSRAADGGIGEAKAAANYAASLLPASIANQEGYDQLIWTDASSHEYIEESGTMNLMLFINDTLITPSLNTHTILPGITRKSVIELAQKWGINIEERRIKVTELIDALKNGSVQEAFGVGTAATIAPIELIGHNGIDYELTNYESWTFAPKVAQYLTDLRRGREEDHLNWLERIV